MVWMVGLIAGLSVFSIWYGVLTVRAATTNPTASLVEKPVEVKQTYMERRVLPLAAKLGRRFESLGNMILPGNVDQQLAWAGQPLNMRRPEFLGFMILMAIAGAIIGFYVGLLTAQEPVMILTLVIAFGILGGYGAILWLGGKVNTRQKKITLTMPDTFDIISTCVAAGLDFDRAVQQTVAGMDGPLAEELQTFLRELRLGVPRAEAYQRLLWRNRAPELQAVVGALLQGQDLGVPVAETLQSQAEAMRNTRLQQAKEAGTKAATNITLISAIIVVPSVLCMFLTLLGYNVWSDLSPVFNFNFGT